MSIHLLVCLCLFVHRGLDLPQAARELLAEEGARGLRGHVT